jgi:chromosome partitioning protein
MPPAIISVASGKGGVGKTTTTANIAVALGASGQKVLAIDLDGQGNLGQALGLDMTKIKISSYHLMTGQVNRVEKVFHDTEYAGVTIIPAQMELFAAETELGGGIGKEYILKAHLGQEEAQAFDIILLDLPPNLGFHTVNGFAASRFVLVPLQMSGFALSGLRQLAHAIRLVQGHLNPQLELLGLVPTFVSPRTHFSRELVEALHMIPNTRVFQPYIPYTVRVAEGSLTGVPVVATGPAGGAAAAAYIRVAADVWEAVRQAPAKVDRAPAPSIAAPPRAQPVSVDILSEQLRAFDVVDEPRAGLWDRLKRLVNR